MYSRSLGRDQRRLWRGRSDAGATAAQVCTTVHASNILHGNSFLFLSKAPLLQLHDTAEEKLLKRSARAPAKQL